ncbi:MAG: hypothetical protein Q8922_12230 [Bacteroidota bacterium]|nr:hypothetical protein [Bacteroidota bacterium]MDP4233717.1 hypothetical protein [Bacteroidota bacterium]MDP4242356.1 hypothetical protein [Bacteroidota bacterium]MDP4288691.1 hypothetical protein [Bacteroidota bacterium]
MRIGNEEFEILVRRQGETGYSAFCPQLELIVRGTAHQQVEEKMKQLIVEHVAKRDAAAPKEQG